MKSSFFCLAIVVSIVVNAEVASAQTVQHFFRAAQVTGPPPDSVAARATGVVIRSLQSADRAIATAARAIKPPQSGAYEVRVRFTADSATRTFLAHAEILNIVRGVIVTDSTRGRLASVDSSMKALGERLADRFNGR
jgi:hypothetical protein